MAEDSSFSQSLPHEFLTKLLTEIDDDTVITIILHGSYARGDAFPPYSDIDLVRITKETPDQKQQKRFYWYDGYLLNLSSRPLSIYKEWLTTPQEAIYRVSTIRDAQILVEKDDSFRALQQEVLHRWTWEPLQSAANTYAGQIMMNQTEIILKMLRALHLHDMVLLADVLTLDLIPTITEAFAVQRGILICSGNTYFHQVQETAGLQSAWTRYHNDAIGAYSGPGHSLEHRGIAALRLFQETARLLQPSFLSDHWDAIEPLLRFIDSELSNEEIR